MRYMALIYSQGESGDPGRQAAERNFDAHLALMEEATRKGVFVGAEPLAPSTTTVRLENGRTFVRVNPTGRPRSSASPASNWASSGSVGGKVGSSPRRSTNPYFATQPPSSAP